MWNCVLIGSSAVVQRVVLPISEVVFNKAFIGSACFGEFDVAESEKVTVAVKIVPAAETAGVLREFEVLSVARECKYIVKLLGCVGASSVYFFMEYMLTNCNDYYKNLSKIGTPISEEEVRCIAFSVTSALQFLQEKNEIMHRDVKPANILLHSNGSVKLSDFGISRVLDKGCSNYTEIATKSYLPPERCRLFYEMQNQEVPEVLVYEYSSDVWCLGVTLIEVAQMFHPYYIEDENSIENQTDWNRQLYIRLSEKGPVLNGDQWTKDFRDFVRDCVRPLPSDRPSYESLLLNYNFLNVAQRPLDGKQISRNIVQIQQSRSRRLNNLPA